MWEGWYQLSDASRWAEEIGTAKYRFQGLTGARGDLELSPRPPLRVARAVASAEAPEARGQWRGEIPAR